MDARTERERFLRQALDALRDRPQLRGLFAGLPRMARAALMGRGSTDVRFVNCTVNRENLHALAALLDGDVKVVIDGVYPLGEAANAVAHMPGHHARGVV
jgi:NADPH:quinone reductase-like Zn-dependent oxidoreductase